jgi:hypothetical protein
MTRSILSRLVLGLAVLTAPAIMLGCSEEPKPAETPAPAGGTATPTPAPSAPADTKTDTAAPATPPAAK